MIIQLLVSPTLTTFSQRASLTQDLMLVCQQSNVDLTVEMHVCGFTCSEIGHIERWTFGTLVLFILYFIFTTRTTNSFLHLYIFMLMRFSTMGNHENMKHKHHTVYFNARWHTALYHSEYILLVLFTLSLQNTKFWGWRNGLAVEYGCSTREPEFKFQLLHGS